MTGVLFEICIPRERYEKCMDNAIRITDLDLNSQPNQGNVSSESSDSSLKVARRNLDEMATVSIQSEKSNKNGTQQNDEEKLEQGSMDSDTFRRIIEIRRQEKEKEEIFEKFYNTPTRKPLDKLFSPMEQVMREIISRMQITNVSWKKINSGNGYKISFCLEKGVRCDETIHLLSEYGIGQKKGSSIAVVPCTYYENRRLKDKDRESTDNLKENAWTRFVGTMRARLNVAKIVEAVKSDASLSFDFIILLVVASILASFGLVEDSTLFLAASMLISPLMGPILAATFGAAIRDHKLQYLGLRNEIIGIFMCILVGFVFGLVISGVNYIFGDAKALTNEIINRCEIHSVIVGICIALPSGAAQSIALLRENFGSLVGVAISASLLPPAVNTGLLWSFSCLSKIFSSTTNFNSFVTEKRFFDDQASELVVLGSISLLVTLTNVFSVYLMGYIFLRLKIEVAPLQNEEERQFWRHDVPITRDYNKTVNAEDGEKLRKELMEFCDNEPGNFKGVGRELLRQDFYHPTHTWSPVNSRYQEEITKELDILYKSMNKISEDKHFHKDPSKGKAHPVATALASTSTTYERHKYGSKEHINRHITFVNVLSSSAEDNEEMPTTSRRFVVTPVTDPV